MSFLVLQPRRYSRLELLPQRLQRRGVRWLPGKIDRIAVEIEVTAVVLLKVVELNPPSHVRQAGPRRGHFCENETPCLSSLPYIVCPEPVFATFYN